MLERVLAASTLTAGAAWAAYVLLFGSDAGPPFPVIIALVGGGAAVLVLWAVRLVVHLVATRRTPERRRLRRLVAEPIALFLIFAFVLSGGAFWVRFMLSRPALNRFVLIASSDIASGSFKPGVRVGLFWLREAEVLPQGAVRIITTDCMLVDACGLVYSAAGAPPVIGEDAYETSGGHWYHWHRRF